jgi:diketogulonate reductase-like aldo/keto reductase
MRELSRRTLLKVLCGGSFAAAACPSWLLAKSRRPIKKPIPVSGEELPVIGMGSSRTFDVDDEQARLALLPVLQAFFDEGGALIDSSPMYGHAEEVLGDLLPRVKNKQALFAATKVWIEGKQEGIDQMQRSMRRMGVKRFDLMQIHNLLDWEVHLETLKRWKSEDRVRYIGITTSHGRYHDQLASILDSEPLDFVQFSYNIANREVEKRLLPLAHERNIAVLINRPFARGDLFRAVKGRDLPAWTAEFDCHSWAQFFLKYVVSHPYVTCTIPATSKLKHMVDNMGAGYGRLPDAAMRKKMEAHFADL